MKTKVLFSLLTLLFFSQTAVADVSPYQTDPLVLKQIEQLASQIKSLSQTVMTQEKTIKAQASEIKQLKKSNQKISKSVAKPYAPKGTEAPEWLEGLKWSGDLRLRYEGIDRGSSVVRDRNRFRFRLRYGFEKTFNEEFKAGFRLASGSLADPTSTNQSFDGLFGQKTIGIDRAYVKYTPKWVTENIEQIDSFEVGAGKFSNPFNVSTQMIWDHDVQPEGLYQKFSSDLNDKTKVYGVLGQFVLEEDAATKADAELYAFKGGVKVELGDILNVEGQNPVLDTSLTYYDYADYATDGNFGILARGNTNIDPFGTELDAKDFNILHLYSELKLQAFDMPLALISEYAMNTHDQSTLPDGENDAWGLSIKLGSLKEKGDWSLYYGYFNVEANAIVGAFSNSDFGPGGSDKRGSIIAFGYKLTDFLTLKTSSYITDSISGEGSSDKFKNLKMDLIWKF